MVLSACIFRTLEERSELFVKLKVSNGGIITGGPSESFKKGIVQDNNTWGTSLQMLYEVLYKRTMGYE